MPIMPVDIEITLVHTVISLFIVVCNYMVKVSNSCNVA